jgi:hypothetical protein
MQANLQAIRNLLTDADLPAKVQQTILSRFDELPELYDELNRTYECRFSDRIVGLVAEVVRVLGAPDAGPHARMLAETMVQRLRAMHDRYGISVILKPLPVPKAAAKKKTK